MAGKHRIKGDEYQICVYSKRPNSYMGMILVTASDGVALSPIVEIPTLTHFAAKRAAEIEADTLALELIHTGAIDALLPPSRTNSWPAPPADG